VYDIGAAICVLVALGALVMPSLQVSREEAQDLRCQDNLHRIGAALMEYSLRFNEGLPQIGPGENAGVFVIELADRGVISREELVGLLVCPSSELAERVNRGCVKMRIPTREEYLAATGAEREHMRRFMAGDYAYSLGYRDQHDKIRQVHFSGSRFVPLLADAPSSAIAGYQSANHGGCGQYVLFQDLSVQYCKQCKCRKKRDHWYLNENGQPAAGCHEGDMVLGPSAATPVIELISAK
jgi:type II secretory pathway pseudopilin PulG